MNSSHENLFIILDKSPSGQSVLVDDRAVSKPFCHIYSCKQDLNIWFQPALSSLIDSQNSSNQYRKLLNLHLNVVDQAMSR